VTCRPGFNALSVPRSLLAYMLSNSLEIRRPILRPHTPEVTDSRRRSPDSYILLCLYRPSLPNTIGQPQSRCRMASLQLGGLKKQALRRPRSKSFLRYLLSTTIAITLDRYAKIWN
jgi:hypothetical protein